MIVYRSEDVCKYSKQASESFLLWQTVAFADTTYKYSKTDILNDTWKSLEIIIITLIYILTKWNQINVVFMKRTKISEGLWISNNLPNDLLMQQMIIELRLKHVTNGCMPMVCLLLNCHRAKSVVPEPLKFFYLTFLQNTKDKLLASYLLEAYFFYTLFDSH